MKIRIGGVPEHFNYPWHYAMNKGYFEKKGIEVSWQDFSSGTGAMCSALKSEEVDLALVLTEGIVSETIKGEELVLIAEYVSSPLLWGIHVPYKSSINTAEEIKNKTYAISRYGSGSHLMAFVDALKRDWPTDNISFKVVTNMEGARKALKNEEAEVFFWEKFMTKPLVDANEFKIVGVRPTPWPCFLIAGRKQFVESNQTWVNDVLNIIQQSIEELNAMPEETIKAISKSYNLLEKDIQEWYSVTKWSEDGTISAKMLDEVSAVLFQLNLIERVKSAKDICCSFTNLVR